MTMAHEPETTFASMTTHGRPSWSASSPARVQPTAPTAMAPKPTNAPHAAAPPAPPALTSLFSAAAVRNFAIHAHWA